MLGVATTKWATSGGTQKSWWDSPVVQLQMFIGFGTVVNIVAILLGGTLGLLVGNRLSKRSRTNVTDALGLITIVIGGLTIKPITQPALTTAVGEGMGLIVVLLSLLIGTLIGSALRLEDQLERFGEWLRRRLTGNKQTAEPGTKGRFVDGFVTATLVFCVGPLAILGSISDGLGRGADQLLAKSVLDGFAALAFASSLGVGVLASVLAVGLLQGSLTILGAVLGDFLPLAQVDALSITGGVILIGLGLRLLNLKQLKVADMLPSLLIAPLLVALWGVFR